MAQPSSSPKRSEKHTSYCKQVKCAGIWPLSYEKLMLELPKFERFFRVLLENKYIANQRRITAALSASAEERYLNFVKTYPAFAQRVPQRHIASYLGITPQSLSRLRKELAEKK